MRRLAVLVANLPSGALTHSDDGWTPELRLAGMNLEVAHATYRAVLAGLGVVRHRSQLPEQLHVLPRPAAKRDTPEQMFGKLAQLRPRR